MTGPRLLSLRGVVVSKIFVAVHFYDSGIMVNVTRASSLPVAYLLEPSPDTRQSDHALDVGIVAEAFIA
jgi:hypothetical protein